MTPGDDSHEDGCGSVVVVARAAENVLRMSRMSGNREASVGGDCSGGGGVHMGCGLDAAVILGGGGGMRENMAGLAGGISIYVVYVLGSKAVNYWPFADRGNGRYTYSTTPTKKNSPSGEKS